MGGFFLCYAVLMSTYDTEFGLNEEVTIRKSGGKRGTVREIVLSSSGAKFTQEYGIEISGKAYEFSHFKRSQLQAIA